MLGESPYARYQEMQVNTASLGQLLLMLYDAAIRLAREGSEALKAGRAEEARRALLKAQDVVAELTSSLDLNAGSLALNLYRLYDYMSRRLVEANIKRDPQAAAEVVTLLSGLREAWAEVVHRGAGSSLSGGGLNVGGR